MTSIDNIEPDYRFMKWYENHVDRFEKRLWYESEKVDKYTRVWIKPLNMLNDDENELYNNLVERQKFRKSIYNRIRITAEGSRIFVKHFDKIKENSTEDSLEEALDDCVNTLKMLESYETDDILKPDNCDEIELFKEVKEVIEIKMKLLT